MFIKMVQLMKISTIFGIIVILSFLVFPAVTLAGAVSNAEARGKPSGGGSTGGIGTAGPASKAGADGIVRKYALSVGVSNYIDSRVGDLSYCDEDANDWKSYLQGKGYSVTLLVDSQAKEPAVESALFSIIAAADADDIIVFATSGHGTTASRKQVLLYADCYAAGTDGDGFVGGIVPDAELKNWFFKCTSKVFIFVDHCNSGGLNEAMHANMYMTTTCTATGYGYDVPQYSNGAWTYHFLHLALQGQGITSAEAAFTYAAGVYPYGGKDAPMQFDQITGSFVF
jgi:hypothetical protein